MNCPICGKQSFSSSTPYCRDHVNIVEISEINPIKEAVINGYVSVELLKDTVDKLSLKMETLDKENTAMTKYMCQNSYELAMEHMKRNVRDTYYSLNWFQRLLWRILGLNRLWLNEK